MAEHARIGLQAGVQVKIRGAIYAAETVENTWRKFGSARRYVCAYLIQSGRPPKPLLLTQSDIADAAERARQNPEDCPPFAGSETDIELELARDPAWLVPTVAVVSLLAGAALAAIVLL
jgi:hypothetical protein